MEPTRSSLESRTTADDRGGTGIGLDASLKHAAAADDDDDGDALCDTECSTHGEQRFIDDTLRVAILDCILVHTHKHRPISDIVMAMVGVNDSSLQVD